jgi:hypothetical protein
VFFLTIEIPIIQRFINKHKNINKHNLYNDRQNIHVFGVIFFKIRTRTLIIQQSVKDSIMNLLNDKYKKIE